MSRPSTKWTHSASGSALRGSRWGGDTEEAPQRPLLRPSQRCSTSRCFHTGRTTSDSATVAWTPHHNPPDTDTLDRSLAGPWRIAPSTAPARWSTTCGTSPLAGHQNGLPGSFHHTSDSSQSAHNPHHDRSRSSRCEESTCLLGISLCPRTRTAPRSNELARTSTPFSAPLHCQSLLLAAAQGHFNVACRCSGVNSGVPLTGRALRSGRARRSRTCGRCS